MLNPLSGLDKFKQAFKEKVLFGNEPTPELIAILTVYFVQGILGLARLAVSFFLKDDLGLSPAEVAALTGIAALPWVIKPVFGLISDGLPLFGYRRRTYLVLSGILGTLSWVALATAVNSAWAAAGAMLLASLSVAISDVIADSLVVERARKESLGQAGSLQSLTWGVAAVGGLITAYLSGWLLEHLSSQVVFGITAIFPLLVSAVAWLIVEEKIGDRRLSPSSLSSKETGIPNQIQQLWGAIAQKSIWLPTAFVFFWQATPSADSAFFFFTTNELGFEPEFLGRVRLVTSLADQRRPHNEHDVFHDFPQSESPAVHFVDICPAQYAGQGYPRVRRTGFRRQGAEMHADASAHGRDRQGGRDASVRRHRDRARRLRLCRYGRCDRDQETCSQRHLTGEN